MDVSAGVSYITYPQSYRRETAGAVNLISTSCPSFLLSKERLRIEAIVWTTDSKRTVRICDSRSFYQVEFSVDTKQINIWPAEYVVAIVPGIVQHGAEGPPKFLQCLLLLFRALPFPRVSFLAEI